MENAALENEQKTKGTGMRKAVGHSSAFSMPSIYRRQPNAEECKDV